MTPTQPPVYEDQIRGYRRSQQLRHAAQKAIRKKMGKRRLEQMIDPEAQIQISQRRRADLVPAEVLYESGWSQSQHMVYQHYSEERICVVEKDQGELPLIHEQSYRLLKNQGMEHIHLGLFMIRLRILFRRETGATAFVVLRDTRWSGEKSIIGQMEVSLNKDIQLIYFSPDLMMSVHDFYNHMEIVVQTHGFDDWVSGESNLLLTKAFVGRITNTGFTQFRYNVENVVEYLATHGIKMIPGKQFEPEQSQLWLLKPSQKKNMKIATRATSRTKIDGSVSTRFHDYTTQTNSSDIDEDEEKLEHEAYVMSISDEDLLWIEAQEEEDRRKYQHDADLRREMETNPNLAVHADTGKYQYLCYYDPPEWANSSCEIIATGWDDEDSIQPNWDAEAEESIQNPGYTSGRIDIYESLIEELQTKDDDDLFEESLERAETAKEYLRILQGPDEEEEILSFPEFSQEQEIALVGSEKEKYYVVFHGRRTGVYDSWPECQEQVSGYSSATYRKYPSYDEAMQAWRSYCSRDLHKREPQFVAQHHASTSRGIMSEEQEMLEEEEPPTLVEYQELPVQRMGLGKTESHPLPQRKSPGAAGYDLYSSTSCIIYDGTRRKVPTGFAVQLPENTYGQIMAKSSLAMQGIDVVAGVIDGDYRGEIQVILVNNTGETYHVRIHQAIAQLIIIQILTPPVKEVNTLTRTLRGVQGFGSTGEFACVIGETSYPMKRLSELAAMSSSTVVNSPYRPAQEPIMGPSGYPPARTNGGPQQPAIPLDRIRATAKRGYERYYSGNWTLPDAQTSNGAMLVLPEQIGLYFDVLSRWESITINLVNDKVWTDNQQKVSYIENLLGESEKRIWIQWRMAFPTDYEQMVAIADDVRNVTSQIRRVFILEDPQQGSTVEQDRAYQDLERLTCNNMRDIFEYMNQFKILAAKSGRMYISTELSEKFIRKMPSLIGDEIEKAFQERYPGNTIGVMPRIYFAHQYLESMCKKAAFQRSLKDLDFCRRMPLPGYYDSGSGKKKLGLRKTKSYKGKPHESHVKVFKKKHQDRVVKCKCYVCGEEGHFARDCTSKKGNIARAAIFENLDISTDLDIVSVDMNEPDHDDIYSFSEGEIGGIHTCTENLEGFAHEFAYFLEEDAYYLGQEDSGWRKRLYLPPIQENCTHTWEYNTDINIRYRSCAGCSNMTQANVRIHCQACKLTMCPLCSRFYLNIQVNPSPPAQQPYRSQEELIRELLIYCNHLMAENERLNRILDNQLQQDFEDLHQTPIPDASASQSADIEQEVAPVLLQESTLKIADNTTVTRSAPPRNYNFPVRFRINGVPEFTVQAILDTGATTCCLDSDSVPKEALEQSPQQISLSGINSHQIAKMKLKQGSMDIGMNTFRIPFIYAFPMKIRNDRIHMLLGCNFIRSLQGGLRIEGNVVTFYKNITTLTTQSSLPAISMEGGTSIPFSGDEGDNEPLLAAARQEEDFDSDPRKLLPESGFSAFLDPFNGFYTYDPVKEFILFSTSDITENNLIQLRGRFRKFTEDLTNLGFIGEDPIKHWDKNKVRCRLDIINPDITIQDKPLKHVTPAMKESFDGHIKALLNIGVIRPSKSRHRTMAFIVNSGTTVDPVTGKEKRGKERMVLNYRTLNDNTYKDQYPLPGISTIHQKISNSRIYSKFDLKSGFHQVLMEEESIPWTAFTVPGGLYEWLVMPFGLKNAPSIFQRKMDDCFRGLEHCIAVYIDDILVFSENEEEHERHLQEMINRCKKFGLVLSPSKMKVATTTVDFLGATIGEGKLKLQEHIIKKIINFKEDDLKEKKGLRSWLGILNYARMYIPKLGTHLGPLYEKTSPHGDKRLKDSDRELIRKIKKEVQNLPDLSIPPKNAYIILETDGCMEGWGGICKWKYSREDPRRTERVCAYASGKFPNLKSTIDAEIHAVTETLNSLKIFYLDKKEITIRTDCQAIISFYNKTSSNKPSRVRWLSFVDFVTGTGIEVKFEHIDGKNNVLADALSRLTHDLYTARVLTEEDDEKIFLITEAITEAQAHGEEALQQTLKDAEKVWGRRQLVNPLSHNSSQLPIQDDARSDFNNILEEWTRVWTA